MLYNECPTLASSIFIIVVLIFQYLLKHGIIRVQFYMMNIFMVFNKVVF